MIFVDTGAWFALVVPDDPQHQRANHWIDENQERLVTTDYVVDELLTLLKARGHFRRAVAVGDELWSGDLGMIEWVTPADVANAWSMFRDFADKKWSFTDCTSKTVIERLRLDTAFAFDEHFRQFGTIKVVPA